MSRAKTEERGFAARTLGGEKVIFDMLPRGKNLVPTSDRSSQSGHSVRRGAHVPSLILSFTSYNASRSQRQLGVSQWASTCLSLHSAFCSST